MTQGSSEKHPRIIQQPHWILHLEQSEVFKWLSNSAVGNLQLAPRCEPSCQLTNYGASAATFAECKRSVRSSSGRCHNQAFKTKGKAPKYLCPFGWWKGTPSNWLQLSKIKALLKAGGVNQLLYLQSRWTTHSEKHRDFLSLFGVKLSD